jgi:hypothetical protein
MACSVKGVGAARIWYPLPSRPSPHDLLSCFASSWRRTKGGPTPGGAFLRYGEGQRAPTSWLAMPVHSNGQSCEAVGVGLGRSVSVRCSPMFSRLHAQPGAAPCHALCPKRAQNNLRFVCQGEQNTMLSSKAIFRQLCSNGADDKSGRTIACSAQKNA